METTYDEPYLLTVLTGPNAGAQIALPARRTSIGGGLSSGVILDGVPDTALDLSLTRNRARVQVAVDGIDIHGVGPCRPGSASVMSLPVVMSLNDATQIHVCRTAPDLPPRQHRRFSRLAILAAAIGLGGIGVSYVLDLPGLPAQANVAGLIPAATVTPGTPQTATEPATLAIPQTVTRPAEIPQIDPAATVEAARVSLETAGAEAGLIGLKISADSETVRVSGSYGTDQAPAWTRLRRAYDTEWGARVPLILGNLTVAEAVAPIAIASALLSDPREVVTRDGTTYRIGDITDAGWTVTSIELDSVGLSKGEAAVEIEF